MLTVVAGAGASALALSTAGPAAAQGRTELVVEQAHNAKLGTILVTTRGLTLYRFTFDRANQVACTSAEACTSIWPPLILARGFTVPTGKGPAGRGLTGLGTIARPGGRLQVTYRGHPLYVFSGDHRPGDTNGQGFAKAWFAVTPSVARLTATAPTQPTPGPTSPEPTMAPTTSTTSMTSMTPSTTTSTMAGSTTSTTMAPATTTTTGPPPTTTTTPTGYKY